MDAVRRSATQPGYHALAKKILLSLAEVDREALVRFYFERQAAEEIEEALGLDSGYVWRLKCLVKGRFLTGTAPRGDSMTKMSDEIRTSIPLGIDANPQPSVHVTSANVAAAKMFAGSAVRVLVAEDNTVNQEVNLLMLKKLGLHADVAANGREAVEMAGVLPYDLIIMDCHMPEMDGYAATREIRRRQGANQRLAIIALTADIMEGSRERCLAAGMDDYMAKPIRMAGLREALRKWVPAAGATFYPVDDLG